MSAGCNDNINMQAPSDEADQRIQQRLKEADEAMRRLFESLNSKPEEAPCSSKYAPALH